MALGEYPGITCRELVANALIHRDLSPVSMIEAITLKIDDDCLILSNPGGLFGLSVNELGQSASRTRNTRLAEICQYVPAADNSTSPVCGVEIGSRKTDYPKMQRIRSNRKIYVGKQRVTELHENYPTRGAVLVSYWLAKDGVT